MALCKICQSVIIARAGCRFGLRSASDAINTAFTEDGIDERHDVITDACRLTAKWDEFLQNFDDDADIIAHALVQIPQQQPGRRVITG